MRLRLLAIALCLGRVVAAAAAEELPGTPSGRLPAPLQDPYEAGRLPLQRPPVRPPLAKPEPVPTIERPWFVLVPDLRVGAGYSDNVFITPDIVGFRPVEDGVVTTSPRFRGVIRLSQDFGLLGDGGMSYDQYLEHGNALQAGGSLFLGYRPSVDRHAEIGVRGGMARVSEFDLSDVNQGDLFVGGTYGIVPEAQVSGSASIGVREFPERARVDVRNLVLGIAGLEIPLPIPVPVVVGKGQEDVVTNVRIGGALLGPTASIRAAYDFTNVDSDFDEIDYQSHRASVGLLKVWTTWLSSQVTYGATFRRFERAISGEDERRRDTLHDIGLQLSFAPAYLQRLPLMRSMVLRLEYDALLDRSNVDEAEFERNFFGASVEIGFLPITNHLIGRTLFPGLYSMDPSVSYSSPENAPH